MGASFDIRMKGQAKANTVLTALGDGNVGIGTTSPSEIVHIKKDINGGSNTILENQDAGNGVYSAYEARNGASITTGIRMGILGTGWSTFGGFVQDGSFLSSEADLSGGLSIINKNTSSPIRFYTAGFAAINERMRITETGNVGIGTTSPSELLHVSGNGLFQNGSGSGGNKVDIQFFDTDNSITGEGSAFLNIRAFQSTAAADVAKIRLRNNGSTGVGANIVGLFSNNNSNTANAELAFTTANAGAETEAMRIDESGNVGIGTTNPTSKLTVKSQGNNWNDGISIEDDATTNVFQIVHDDRFRIGYNSETRFQVKTTGEVGVGKTDPTGFFQVTPDQDITFDSTFYVGRNGNVGIGTTSPAEKLSVVETVDAKQAATIKGANTGTGTGFYSQLGIVNTNSSANTIVGVELNHSNAASTEKTAASLEATLNDVTSGTEQGNLRINTMTSGTVTEKMRIDAAGNVGIGTTSPTYKLDVAHSDGLAITVKHSTKEDSDISYSNLVTGTDLSGDITWLIGDGSSAQKTIYVGARGGANDYDLRLQTASLDRMTVTAAGNVGIGTTSPTRKLQVQDGSSLLYNPSGNGLEVYGASHFERAGTPMNIRETTNNGSSLGGINFERGDGSGTDMAISTIGDLSNGVESIVVTNSVATNLVTFRNDGNVGIGTTNPQNSLEVAGSVLVGGPTNATGALYSWTNDNLRILSGNTGGAGVMLGATTGNDPLAPDYHMRIDGATGNVGIGTTSPSEKIEFSNRNNIKTGRSYIGEYGGGDGLILGNNIGAGNSNVALYKSTGTNASSAIELVYSKGIAFHTFPSGVLNTGDTAFKNSPASAYERLRITPQGNVGIGTTSPSQKLHVIGNILASGTITPDYVFEKYFEGKSKLNPKYEMLSLSDIEKYTKKHKHLPGVPSAKEISANGGIMINRATEINLEKIEELYLHTIELSKDKDALLETNKAQQDQIENQQDQIENQQDQIENQQDQMNDLKSELKELRKLVMKKID